jgi:hypothetical protein
LLELDSAEQSRQDRPPRPRASWCEPDQQLVTGRPRRELVQWLTAMSHATSKQVRTLDGLGPDCDIAAARQFLAREGFVEVLDARGNADSGHGAVDLLCVNTDTGLIATVTASDPWGRGTQLSSISVAYNVAVLDLELFLTFRGAGGMVFDSQDRATNLAFGSLTVHARQGWNNRSLRTTLAALRAFTAPVTPWIHPVWIPLGIDGVPADERRSIMSRLPQAVHELFGPHLLDA